jgi:archaellum component FlaC
MGREFSVLFLNRHISSASDNTSHSKLERMEAMRQSWTDDRLDTLNEKVDQRFDQVDQRFDQVDQRFEQVDQRFEQVDQRFDQVDRRLGDFDRRLGEFGRRLDRVEGELREVSAGFNELRSETKAGFESLYRSQIFGVVTITAGTLAGFGAMVGLFATQV